MQEDTAVVIKRRRRAPARSRLKMIVLAELLNGENYGKEIMRANGLGNCTSIYSALASLELSGMLTSRMLPAGLQMPPRRVYALTDAGRELAAQWGVDPLAGDDEL